MHKPLHSIGSALLLTCTSLSMAAESQTAKASVTVAGKTFNFDGGACVKSDGGLTVVMGPPKGQGEPHARADSFGIMIPKSPGPFTDGIVSFTKDGVRYSLGKANGVSTDSGGSFSGNLMRQDKGPVTGSFTC